MARLIAEIQLPQRYVHTRHLASGGMAAVFAAEDTVLGRPVAVKLMAEQFLSDPQAVRRFQREARAAAKASQHPHVVTIYDVGEHDGRPFIVMELMSGGSLATVLADGPPPRADALRWIRETASALDHAHGHGVVHRDVKPGNLLLDGRGRLAVADFGIARLVYESAVTQTGQVLGTASYLAPEQARGEEASAASDRYALAVVAHELLTGERPAGTPPDVPPAMERALRRGLDPDPDARWPTCMSFAEALGGKVTESKFIPTAATRPFPAPTLPQPALSRRQRAPLLAVVAIAAVLLAAILAMALSGGDDSQPTRAERSQPPRTAPPKPETQSSQPANPAPASPAPSGEGESAASLNNRGFALMNEGRYGEAIPLLQQAVDRCGDSRESVCAYALFNLGRSLRLAGRPAEAIPILQRRLGYGDQTETVQAELDAALRAAGQGAPESDGSGKGKHKDKGHGKGHKRDRD